MSRQISTVKEALLHVAGDAADPTIEVGSPVWYRWLEQHSSFHFEAPQVSFTARKEKRSGGWYWYAQRRRYGKLQTTYLGKSEELSAQRLSEVAGNWQCADEVRGGAGSTALEETDLAPIALAPAFAASEPASQPPLAAPRELPRPFTPLLGRAEDVRHLTQLLRKPEVRLVSLVGPGGIGKTRLALEVASQLKTAFPDGVYLLQLASMRDPQAALSAIAQELGLPTDGHRSVLDLLGLSLKQRQLLLVLDNLEQVQSASSLLVDLAHACSDLKMLVTSRELLHLPGEHPFLVSPLSFPDLTDPLSVEAATVEATSRFPAMDLFIQRARASEPNLTLDGANLQSIARICASLEGLPLAIELAAARTTLLPPQALLQRLSNRLALLTRGGPDRPARHQTLRATFEWSYDLLSPDEQRVFRRLAAFAGGCGLEAAEQVCTAPGDVVTPFLDVVSSLIDKSLLLRAGTPAYPPRVRLSETVHEYASDLLASTGEVARLEEAHAGFYLSFVEHIEPQLWGAEQEVWIARLDQDDQNLKAALQFLLSARDRDRSVRMAGALGRFWHARGRLAEGLFLTEQALALRAGGASAVTDRGALMHGAVFAINLDQGERARPWLEECIELCKSTGDTVRLSTASHMLVLFLLLKGNVAQAEVQAQKAADFVRGSNDPAALAAAHSTLAALALYFGDFSSAHTSFGRSAALFKEAGDFYLSDLMSVLLANALAAKGDREEAEALLSHHMDALNIRRSASSAAYLLCAYAQFALQRGDWPRARLLLEQSAALFSRLHDPRGVARAYLFLAQTALHEQDYSAAVALAKECLQNARAAGAMATIIGCLEELADVAVHLGKVAWAAQLWGAAERQRQATDPQQRPLEPAGRAQLVKTARDTLGTKMFSAAWDEGRSMPLDQLLSTPNLARSIEDYRAALTSGPEGLTRREREVLMFVAAGLTNAEIAERLVITPSTVVSYLNLIYKKLNVSSRTAAMRYVIDHQLS